MQLSIIIVSYNVRALLAQCIASVTVAARELDYELIVVDNDSKDDTYKYFTSHESDVKFIWSKENPGFAKANNMGLSVAKGKYILFLNPDTIVSENCFRNCLAHLENTAQCGAVGVHMIDGTGNYLPESKRNAPGVMSSFFYFSGISKLGKNSAFFNGYHAGNVDRNMRSEVPVLSGAFMMASTELIRKCGGFDPRYFMYAEDVDLSMTIVKSGYKNWYLGDVKILHYKGESSIVKSAAYYDIFFAAMKVFTKKHSRFIAGKLKLILINFTSACFKMKAGFEKRKSAKTDVLSHNILLVYCNDADITAIESLNDKYKFAKKLVFAKESDLLAISSTAVLYSTSLYTYSTIIEKIEKHETTAAKYIFNPSFHNIIGSSGKSEAAVVFSL